MPQQLQLGAKPPSINSKPTHETKTEYIIAETKYFPTNARDSESKKPYSVFTRDQNGAFNVATLDHGRLPGYKGSHKEHSTIVSEYEDGSKIVTVVQPTPNTIEQIINS